MSKENGSKPINATPYMDMTNSSGEFYCDNTGLTKREHVAIEMMKAMISNQDVTKIEDAHDDHSIGIFCNRANLIADTLLDSWDK